MRDQGEKMAAVRKTWIAAGIAAATLFSVQALGAQTVAAAEAAPAVAEVSVQADLLNRIANNKKMVQAFGNVKDTVTNRSFYGDFDYLAGLVRSGKIADKDALYAAMKPIAQGVKEYLKATAKKQVAAVGNVTDPVTKRSFYGAIDYLFNSAVVTVDDSGVGFTFDPAELNAIIERAQKAMVTEKADDTYATTDRTPHIKTPVTETVDDTYATTDRTPHVKTPVTETVDDTYATTDRTPHVKTPVTETVDDTYATTDRTPHIKTPVTETVDDTYGQGDRTPHVKTPVTETVDDTYATTDRTPHVKTPVTETVDDTYGQGDRTPHVKTPVTDPIDDNNDQTDPTPLPKTPVTDPTDDTKGQGDPTPTIKPVAAKTPAPRATKAALPQTGDEVNPAIASLGVVAVIGALFGLAGHDRKRRA
ncbi:LPXTG cell wall anchor domain-containing protein [Lacticaseibacillus absianus]|uniref:LPXTG cell wall anchor domain-containing protein n=1 Tax=Lacticaseibacillus absianus TaxID=2729623 RepID=UPI0015CC9E63|nr:LPXTG cell wall anchor domain-containing protein [Lacticaseibacillus absianus]